MTNNILAFYECEVVCPWEKTEKYWGKRLDKHMNITLKDILYI